MKHIAIEIKTSQSWHPTEKEYFEPILMKPNQSPHFIFKSNDSFARFLVIQSLEDKTVTFLSPFVIENQVESLIGTPKSIKKLKNKRTGLHKGVFVVPEYVNNILGTNSHI